MRILYGSSLPPGVAAPTRGELRIRVEKLLLRDNLVHLNIMSEATSVGSRPYAIPPDHCAVGPLLWGEKQPTCQCIPATPGKSRGAVSLVYPLKTYEPQFTEYVTHMSNSDHRGAHISVFVPTSYSGRHRSIPVGKSIVALDTLKPSSPISGWFVIMSDEVTVAGSAGKNENVTPGVFMEVGKLKLTFTVTFFSRMHMSPSPRANRAASARTRSRSIEKEEGIDTERHQSGDSNPKPMSLSVPQLPGGVFRDEATPRPLQERKNDHGGLTGNKQVLADPRETVDPALTAAPTQVSLPKTTRVEPTEPAEELNQRMAIGQLLQKGLSLRDKMAKALSPSADIDGLTSSSLDFLLTRSTPNSFRVTPGYISLPSGAEHLHNSAPFPCELLKSSPEGSSTSASVESLVSDEENLHTVEFVGEEGSRAQCDASEEKQLFRMPSQSVERPLSDSSYVEVDLSQIAFSTGKATLGMEEMRVGICLSKDVKTDEPVESYSSYVHRVPLLRGAEHHIVIGFLVRSFSEDKSRMVIMFYRVRSAPVSNPPGEKLLPVPATAQRVLVEETLLGMCIVGLYSQSRDIVFHDPVTGEDPTQAHLRVSIRSGPRPCTEDGCVHGKLEPEPHVTQCTTSVWDGMKSKVLAPSCGDCPTSNKAVQDTNYAKLDKNVPRKRKGKVHPQIPSSFFLSPSSSSSPSAASLSAASSPSLSHSDRSPTKRKCDDGDDNDDGGGGGGDGDDKDNLPKSSSVHKRRSSSSVAASSKRRHQEPHTAPCDSLTAADVMGVRRYSQHARPSDAATILVPGVNETQTNASSGRFRIHVAIRAGKELPMVTLTCNGPPLMSFVAATDHLESGVRSVVTTDGRLVLVDSEHRVFQPPSTFFVVEDVFSGVDSRAASKGAVPDWFVEAAVRGKYDRTWIIPDTQSPQYNYECILSLPREAVYLQHSVECGGAAHDHRPSLIAAHEASTKSLVASLCLQELRLTLWHAVHDTSGEASRESSNEEEGFWTKTAVLGECRVDLRSLRFLKVLDGWYRIHAVDKVNEVIGYVRVGVRLL